MSVMLKNCSQRELKFCVWLKIWFLLSFYDDADNDPYEGIYDTIVEDFTVPIAQGMGFTPRELANRVYASAQQPQTPNAFLLLSPPANDPTGDPKVTLFH